MPGVMGICGGLVGPKSGNVGFALILIVFFEGPREPDRPGGGKSDTFD